MQARSFRVGGFTMVELMIAAAIVAILAAMAIPMYHSHTVRAKVTECIGLATPPKLAVSEALSSGRGINYEFTPTRYCENIQIANSGTIVMNTRDTGASTEPVLQLVPAIGGGGDANIQWDCQVVAGRPAHVPSSCRGQGTLPDLSSNADGLFVVADSGGGGSSGAAGSGASGGSASGAGASGSGSSGDASGSGASGSGSSDSGSSGGGSSDGGSSDGGSPDGSSSDGSSSDGGSPNGGSSDGGSSGSGSSDDGSSGSSSSGGGSSGGGSSDDGSSGSSSSGGGSSGGGSSGGGGDAEPAAECPFRKKDGSPHPGKCKDWESDQG